MKRTSCHRCAHPFVAFFAVATALCVVGCSSPKATRDEPILRTPHDFSIDMAIFASPDQAGNPDEPKAGVYMLKPGGAVHIRMGTTAIDRGHPPFTGRMSPGEAEQVWFFVQDSGLLLPGNSSQVSASSMVGKRYHRSVAALVITAGGKRRWFKVSLDTSSPDAATVRKLISELARFGPLP